MSSPALRVNLVYIVYRDNGNVITPQAAVGDTMGYRCVWWYGKHDFSCLFISAAATLELCTRRYV